MVCTLSEHNPKDTRNKFEFNLTPGDLRINQNLANEQSEDCVALCILHSASQAAELWGANMITMIRGTSQGLTYAPFFWLFILKF